MQKTYFIGIDVFKNELDFAVVNSNKVLFHLEVTNDKKGIEDFIKAFKKQTAFSFENSSFCMEFTGIYNNILLNYLTAHKASIWLENARQIKDSMGNIRGKTDKLDSILISQYAYHNRENPRLWLPKRDIIQELDGLTAMRSRLKNAIKMLETPLVDSKDFICKKLMKIPKMLARNLLMRLRKMSKMLKNK